MENNKDLIDFFGTTISEINISDSLLRDQKEKYESKLDYAIMSCKYQLGADTDPWRADIADFIFQEIDYYRETLAQADNAQEQISKINSLIQKNVSVLYMQQWIREIWAKQILANKLYSDLAGNVIDYIWCKNTLKKKYMV